MKDKFKNRGWYNTAVALCIAVVLFILLSQFPGIWAAVKTFFGYFSTVIVGCVIAYIVNLLARIYRRRLFKNVKKADLLSNALAFITVIVAIALCLLMLIPQLISGVSSFIESMDGYIDKLMPMIESLGIMEKIEGSEDIISSSEQILTSIATFLQSNVGKIISTGADVGKGIAKFAIGFLLAMYMLAERPRIKAGFKRLFAALLSDRHYNYLMDFFVKCDVILYNYIVFNVLDCLIVGVANALFMTAMGMPYIGVVSFVVAVTNLIPTFGPIFGALIGAFILVLYKPGFALAFLIFTVIIQIVDGYILKPRLFGNSLGVSGLWILVGILVGGSMFGIIGILLAIPAVAIIDFIYHEYIIRQLEIVRQRRRAEEITGGNGE